MAWSSGGLLPSRRVGEVAGCGSWEGGGGEEALRRRHQLVDAAVQPVGRDRVLEQAPDTLDRIMLMRAVFGQPQDAEAGLGRVRQPLPDQLGVMRDHMVQ